MIGRAGFLSGLRRLFWSRESDEDSTGHRPLLPTVSLASLFGLSKLRRKRRPHA
jgi:hypothetical protein